MAHNNNQSVIRSEFDFCLLNKFLMKRYRSMQGLYKYPFGITACCVFLL